IAPIGELRFVQLGDINALHMAFAAGGAIDTGENVQQRGFAGAGGAHEREKFTSRDIERDFIERGDLDFTLRVNLREIADADDVAVVGHERNSISQGKENCKSAE